MRRKYIMSTNACIIGFLGIEAYDIILYLSKLLSGLDKKILLMDNSESGALTCCIPIPATLNPKFTPISCGDMDFVRERKVAEYKEKYEYILMDFGFRINHEDLNTCSYLFLICDRQQHNIERLRNLKEETEVYVILRDIVNFKVKDYILNNLAEKIHIKDCYCLYRDEIDKEYMLGLQYGNQIALKKLSAQFNYVLNQIFTKVLHFERVAVVKAYKKAKRGA